MTSSAGAGIGSSPTSFPYRRGISDVPYSQQPWIIAQYSGFTSPEETNLRFRKMIEVGQSGPSVALDLPTQLGMDPDHPLAEGEVGRVGVSLACVDDMAALFDGIPLSSVRQISTTGNSIGAMFAAMLLVVAERRGEDPNSFSLRLQNDVLKEYVARGTQIFPAPPAAQLSVDVVEYCANNLPRWVPMSVSGYHIRDAGASREQEVGFTLANAEQYLDLAVERGIDIAQFASSMSWFMASSPEFLKEAAKFRACREVWARLLKDKYGVDSPAAAKLRLNIYTLGGELSPYEVINNSVRVTLAALGAVLGGAQSLFCSSIDEAVGLPSEETARLSIQTQKIILREAGIADWIDPLGESRVIERETDDIIAAVHRVKDQVSKRGGSIAAIESGWMRDEIDASAWQRALDERVQTRVGEPEPGTGVGDMPEVGQVAFAIDPHYEVGRKLQIERWRSQRDQNGVAQAKGTRGCHRAGWQSDGAAHRGLSRQPYDRRSHRHSHGPVRQFPPLPAAADGRRGVMTPVRVLATKLGLDGHDRGLRMIARQLRDDGAEVVYLGLATRPDEAAHVALQEDVDVIAVSLLSGSHMSHIRKLMAALKALDADIPVVCGGLIPQSDIEALHAMGVADVKAVGTPLPIAAEAIIAAGLKGHSG